MLLTIEQLRALADLKRHSRELEAAQAALHDAERRCWQMGISDRQIGVIIGKSGTTVCRRRIEYEAREAAR